GPITFSGKSSFGASDLSASTSRYIVVNTGASVSTTSGDVTLQANQQTTPTTGQFIGIGINVLGSITSDSGSILLAGRGGSGTNNNFGVSVAGAGARVSSADGAIHITGTGAGTGENNFGVELFNGGQVSSTGAGAVTIEGTGGSGT